MGYTGEIVIKMITCFLLIISLASCSEEKNKKIDKDIVTIKLNEINSTLFYTGSILPLKSTVIPSPVEGVIVEMPFQYGDFVKSGDLLFLISSEKFMSDYKSALMSYLKAKNEFDNNKVQLSESEFLHKNELISDDDFKMKKSNYYSSQLGLLQAKDTLESFIRQLNVKDINLYNLSISDIEKITNAIHLQSDSNHYIRIISPIDGVMLGAIKNEDDNNKKFNKGDAVKASEVLSMIGDMNGLSIQIKVNELTVNQLHVGQKVKVTGIAFSEESLEGEVKQVDRQGEAVNGGMPNFTVRIAVPKLTQQQKRMIHVGMTAKVSIDVHEKPSISIPVSAIFEENGDAYVRLTDKLGQTRKKMVKTGKTTIDSVIILSGLSEGDNIVIPH